MITTDNLPTNYTPYQRLDFCSNTISGGGHIFAMGKVLPLLIGAAAVPRVWLQAVVAPLSKEFIVVVADSKSFHPAVDVTSNAGKVVVSVRGKTVLAVTATNDLCAVVSEVDFRPLGLNVFGDTNGLNLGGMRLGHNTFEDVGVAFGLGG